MTVEYAVLCPRDGKVRDLRSPDYDRATRFAKARDVSCGRCDHSDGKHVVVSRTVTAWLPVPPDIGYGCKDHGPDDYAECCDQFQCCGYEDRN